MKVTTPRRGGVCVSRQGRDKGRYYLIKEVNKDGTVTVTDGNFRKLSAPKKKNIKHLTLLPDLAEAIAEKFEEGRQVYDTEIYSALRPYNDVKGGEGENK